MLKRRAKNAADLLRQAIELLQGERADEAIRELADLAVSRRGEVVAQVRAATELSDAQNDRLTEVLTRIYGHPVTIQLDVDPALLGGLTIAVGDEVIDGRSPQAGRGPDPVARLTNKDPHEVDATIIVGRRKAMAELTISADEIQGAIEEYVAGFRRTPSAKKWAR